MDRNRFETLFPEDKASNASVVLVGCGGIGSYTAAILARLGIGSLTLVDFDRVEETNVATQDLSQRDIDELKVASVAARLSDINPTLNINTSPTAFAARHLEPEHILIMAVDSIKARQEIYAIFKAKAIPGQVLIDPRMGAESFELWVVRYGSDFQVEYERSLFDPTPRPELPCGERAIAYTGAFAGSLTANAVKRAVMDPKWECWVVGDVGSMRMQVLREIKEAIRA